jgi:tRNA uridine 5-carboxymethylaminomethyl modification enzyme
MTIGRGLGLISAQAAREASRRQAQIAAEIRRVRKIVIKPQPGVNACLAARGTARLTTGSHPDQLLKRAELDYSVVEQLAPAPDPVDPRVARQVEIEIKYEGYIKRQFAEIERFRHMEQIRLPGEFDFNNVHGLSNELKQKLSTIRPTSLGQASRISGMTPAALSVLMVALRAGAK